MSELEGLWLRTLQTIVDKAAHEIKDSLNGVSLNIEVVRSRSEKEGPAAALSQFAAAASDQFETLSERAEALLFLARPQRREPRLTSPWHYVISLPCWYPRRRPMGESWRFRAGRRGLQHRRQRKGYV